MHHYASELAARSLPLAAMRNSRSYTYLAGSYLTFRVIMDLWNFLT